MSSSRALGYAAKGVGQPLEPFTYELPEMGEHDVRVSITHCGVCHTDIHAIDDYYGITTFPFARPRDCRVCVGRGPRSV